MSKIYSPFNDSSFEACSPKQFVGRKDLLEEFENHLTKNIGENEYYFLITGNYGMGKTSFLRYFSEYLKNNYDFLTCSISLHDESIDKPEQIVKQILSNLLNTLEHNEMYIPFEERIRNRIKRKSTYSLNNFIEYLGDNILEETWRGYEFKEDFLEKKSKNFAKFLSELMEKINYNGLNIRIESFLINNIARFSNWFYNLVKDLEKLNIKMPLVITIELPQKQANEFYNYDKLFQEKFLFRELGRLKDSEVKKFLEDGFNSFEWKIEENVMDMLVDLSVGHPQEMTHIGNKIYYSYVSDVMEEIDPSDGIHCMVYNRIVDSKEGAIKTITEYLDYDLMINAIELKRDNKINELCFSILKKIANDFKENFNGYYNLKKSDIFEKLTDNEKLIFDEYMKHLEELDILKIENNFYNFYRIHFLINFRKWLLKYQLLDE
ncbi:MAG: hypothetical protein IKV87_04170 [Methanobrevibacter sp.]|nr:hypothetical protein [Methanobrevibacter sp.]